MSPAESQKDEHELVIGTIVAGRYLVHRLLGTGGMGAVYEAEHVQLKKRVALKVLHGHMSVKPEVLARFEREAVAAGRIVHPSVVNATDFGRLGTGSFYLALEYVNGVSLSELIERETTLAPARALSIAHQMASALSAAHAQGIVHRDLKPDNVMLMDVDGDDFVKVLDFGIAKIRLDEMPESQERLTRAGLVFGTPDYMSPEQARGATADERSDLYSLGMIFYEMLSGRAAFHSGELMAILTAQMADPPPPLPDTVPRPIADLVYRLLEKEPSMRPQSADELVEEMSTLALGLGYSLPAPRTSAGSRFNRPASVGRVPMVRPVAALRSLSMRPVGVGSARFPLWIPALTLLVGLGAGGYLVLLRGGQGGTGAAATQAAAGPTRANFAEKARTGDREALAELRKQVEQDRVLLEATGVSIGRDPAAPAPVAGEIAPADQKQAELRRSAAAARLMALGRGYSVIRHYPAVITSYRDAVHLDPHLADDSELLVDVRVALEQRDAVEEGLELVLEFLGSHGADMVYDIWQKERGKPGMTAIVARAMKLVKGDALRSRASEALAIAIDLERAEVCAEYKQLLPRAELHADERSLATLRGLELRGGCGPGAKKDCFPCLRDDDATLTAAIRAAEGRKEPAFLGAARRELEGK